MPKYRVLKDSFIFNSFEKAGKIVDIPEKHPNGEKFELSDNFALIGTKEDKAIVAAIKNEELLTTTPAELPLPLEADESLV